MENKPVAKTAAAVLNEGMSTVVEVLMAMEDSG